MEGYPPQNPITILRSKFRDPDNFNASEKISLEKILQTFENVCKAMLDYSGPLVARHGQQFGFVSWNQDYRFSALLAGAAVANGIKIYSYDAPETPIGHGITLSERNIYFESIKDMRTAVNALAKGLGVTQGKSQVR